MDEIILTKAMQVPTDLESLRRESTPDKHERWLRTLIIGGLTPIYIGDQVKVSDRYIGESPNPRGGKIGVVTDLIAHTHIDLGVGHVNFDLGLLTFDLIYQITAQEGSSFDALHYELDRTHQPSGNRLLEKLLRETNTEFNARYRR